MTDTGKLQAWLCFRSTPELKPKKILAILEQYPDPLAFVGNSTHPLYDLELLDPHQKQHLLQVILPENYPQILKLCQHYQIGLLGYGDALYPTILREIFSPPMMLWYRGDIASALSGLTLGVVGTRKPSAYGREMCRKLLEPVCQRGVTVISGLAMGIDTVAHQTAVDCKAPTLAVMGGGLDKIYPSSNHELAKRIIQHGALISEYDPQAKMERWNFPARNRIIAALSAVTFVVEGQFSSGALLTAKFAVEMGRDVLALPGNINHPNAQGPNYLIKTGAQLISCPEDLLSCMGLDAEVKDQLEILPDISEDEQAIYDLFRQEQREISFDELIMRTGLAIGKLSVILLNLELKNYLGKSGGNSFILL